MGGRACPDTERNVLPPEIFFGFPVQVMGRGVRAACRRPREGTCNRRNRVPSAAEKKPVLLVR